MLISLKKLISSFIDALEIDTHTLEETPFADASSLGRMFAKSGGIASSLKTVAQAEGVKGIRPVSMNGIEGMACNGGALNLHHDPKSAKFIDNYSNNATKKVGSNFIKINKSRIVNRDFIAKFDLSWSGTMLVVMKNGEKDYVSRRLISNVKEKLKIKYGIKN